MPGQLVQELADRQLQPGAARPEPHQVGDLQGEHAREDVDADVVVGPVGHRGEGHHMRVLHLPEGELGLGLGPVAATTSGTGQSSWLVISTCLPKTSSSRAARAPASTPQVRRSSLGCWPSSCQVTTRRTHGLRVISAILASTFSRGRQVLLRASVAASSSSLRTALARVVPSNPRACAACRLWRVCQDRAPPGPVGHPAGCRRQSALRTAPGRRPPAPKAGNAVRSGQSLVGTDPM